VDLLTKNRLHPHVVYRNEKTPTIRNAVDEINKLRGNGLYQTNRVIDSETSTVLVHSSYDENGFSAAAAQPNRSEQH
jgi:hypothetical protein